MGLLRVTIEQVSQLGSSLSSHVKTKSKLSLRFTSLDSGSDDSTDVWNALNNHNAQEIEAKRDGRSARSTKFIAAAFDKTPVVTNPACSTFPAIELSKVRFSSFIAVELMGEKHDRPLCHAFLSVQHNVLGVDRIVTLKLYPLLSEVSEELPATSTLGTLRLKINAADFCPDPSTVDHVLRTEDDVVHMERLRLFFMAYSPNRLPYLDVEGAIARDAHGPTGGWEGTFRRLLQENNYLEPKLRTVRVTIKCGKEFPMEDGSYIDPYIQLCIAGGRNGAGVGGLGDLFQTATLKNQQNPVFNETFDVKTFLAEKDVLRFRLWDYDMFDPDDFVGDITFPMGLLVQGVPTTRTLRFETSKARHATLEVSLIAVDFGLDPLIYGDLVASALREDLPRLDKFYERYDSSARKNLEQDMINYSLTPGSFEQFIQTLVKRHGLEPGKDTLRVSIQSIQNMVLPKTRAKIDFTKVCAAPGEDPSKLPWNHTHEPFQVKVNGSLVFSYGGGRAAKLVQEAESANASRISFKKGSMDITTYVRKPETESVRIEVLMNRRHNTKGFKEKPKCDIVAGVVELSIASLVNGQTRTRTHSLICGEHGASDDQKNWVNGSVTVSLSTDFVGSATPTYSCLDDDEVESAHRRRLCGLIRRYENSKLFQLDKLLHEHSRDPQLYMDGLVKTYGPEPGTFRIQLTVERCDELPRVELSGAGVDAYVIAQTAEEKFSTAVVKSRSPSFLETFELDIRSPFTENIQLTVLDYDANSDDDPIAIASIPTKSLSGTAEVRVLPLIAHSERANLVRHTSTIPVLHGTIRVTVRAIGFGPEAPFIAPEVADKYRQRLLQLYLRYTAMRASEVEGLVWKGIDQRHYCFSYGSDSGSTPVLSANFEADQAAYDVITGAEQSIQAFVTTHGRERDQGTVRVSLLRVEGHLQGKPEENFRGGDNRFTQVSYDRQLAASSLSAAHSFLACGTVVTDPKKETREFAHVVHQPRSRALARSSNGLPGVYDVNADFVVDLEQPNQDIIYLTLCDGVTVAEVGTATVSTAAMIRGAAPRRIRVPLVAKNEYVAGWVVLSLSSDVVGIDPTMGILPVPEDVRTIATERLVRYMDKYAPAYLSTVDTRLAQAEAGLWLSNGTPSAAAALPFPDVVLREAAQYFGAVEPGTFRLVLQVSECTNLPRIEVLTAGDPYILVSADEDENLTKKILAQKKSVRTSVSKPTTNPKFPQPQETLYVDFMQRPTPRTSITLTVMDYDTNSKDDEWCRVVVPLASLWLPQGSSTFSQPRTIPLVPLESNLLPNYTKTLTAYSGPIESGGYRKSAYNPPTVTFSAQCIGFGDTQSAAAAAYVDQISPLLSSLRMSIYRILHRHSPLMLPLYEDFTWQHIDPLYHHDVAAFNVQALEEKTLATVEGMSGKGEGRGLVKFTVLSIEKLVVKGKPAKNSKPYITFLPSDASAIHVSNESIAASEQESHRRTKTQKATPGPNHMNINETLIFDIPKPDDRYCYMTLKVDDDVVGPDYEFGRVNIYFGNKLLQDGVPRKRTYPIIHNPGQSDATLAGYVTLSITANGLANKTPVDEETQDPLLKRIFGMYKRYNRGSMHLCDSLGGLDRLADLEALVLKHGPEPGTFRALVTVHKCENIPKVEALGAGCDPYVEISHGWETVQTKVMKNNLNPVFEEQFDVDVVDPIKGLITFTVMDYDAGDEDDPVGRLIIPVTSLFGEGITRTYPLPLVYDVARKVKKRTGSITISARAIGFGLHQPVTPVATEADIRNRIAAVYDFYGRPLPEDYEVDLWKQPLLEEALRVVIAKCGPEPGSRTLNITIDAIEGLLDGNGRLVNDATPYVKVIAANALGGTYDIDTKTSTTKGANQPNYQQTVSIELANPQSDVITLQVMNDVVGADYNFGKVCISAILLQQGVAKKRRLPIIKIKEGGQEAQVRGYLVVTLLSDRFGRHDAWDEEAERTLTSRLQGLYARHRPGLVEAVDSRVAKNLRNWEKFLADEVVLHGPEPRTYTVQLQFSLPPLQETSNASNTVSVDGETNGTVVTSTDAGAVTTSPTTTSASGSGKVYSFLVDVVSPTEVLTVSEKDKNGKVLRQSQFSIAWAVRDGQPHRKMVTVSPTTDAVKSISSQHIKMMEMTLTTTTCGNVSSTAQYTVSDDLENEYRNRMIKLYLRSDPASLVGVDQYVLGRSEGEMKMNLAGLVAVLGAESGQTTVAVAIRNIDELADSASTSAYAKVYLNGVVPIGKRLAAEAHNAPADAAPVFSTPIDILRLQEDVIHVKLGTAGFMKSTVVGRGCHPVSLTQLGHRVDGAGIAGGSFHAENVFEVRVWMFDEEQKGRPYVGRVTLWIRITGFPPLPSRDAEYVHDPRTWGRFGGPSLAEAVISKEVIAAGWYRTRPDVTPKAVSDFVRSAMYAPSGQPSSSLLNTAKGLQRASAPTLTNRRNLQNASMLYLHVVGCRGLPKMDTFGTSDTFVDLVVVSQGTSMHIDAAPNQRTAVHSGTLNPNFRFHRDDVFAFDVTNPKQLGLLPLAAAVPREDTTVPLVVGSVMQLTQEQQAPPSNRPKVQLHVKDRDPGSEELIGIAEVSMEILAAGFYNVNAAELLSLSTSAGSVGKGQLDPISSWIQANESRILKLPIVLPGTSQRGEILLVTTSESLNEPNTFPYFRHTQSAATNLNATAGTAAKIFASHKCWAELESLHSYLYDQLFCSAKINQKLAGGAGSLEERCSLWLQSLLVEYGPAK